MKALCIGALGACTFLSGSNTLGPNPSMRPVVEPRDTAGSYQKPEFITKYNDLVNNKESNKIVASEKPIKLLSHSLMDKWKLSSNQLISAVNADASFEKYHSRRTDKDLVHYTTELRKQVAALSKQVSTILEQYPIYTYKKPVLKSKPKYDENEKISARKSIKDTASALGNIASEASRIKMDIQGILSNVPTDNKGRKSITAIQEQIYTLAADFAAKISDLAGNLENEVNELK